MSTHGGVAEVADDALDLGGGRGARLVGVAGDLRGAPGTLAGELAIGARSAVEDLHQGHRAVRLDGRREPLEAREELVVVDAQLAFPALSAARHVRGAGHDRAESAPGAPLDPAQLVV